MSANRPFWRAAALILAVALALSAAAALAATVQLRWKAEGNPSAVFLAGDFNHWNPTGTPMEKDGGEWVVTIDLPPGRYQYKFVADGNWYADRNAKESVDDGFGGQNSVLQVGEGADTGGYVSGTTTEPDAGAAVVGGAAAGAAIAGGGRPAGAIAIEWTPDESYSRVFLTGEFNDWSQDATPMAKDGDTWRATVDLAEGRYQYKFVADGSWIVDPNADELVDDGYGGQNGVLVVGGGASSGGPGGAAAVGVAGVAVAAGAVAIAWKPDASYSSVYVAGEFNDWSTTATPMTKDGDTWRATVDLAEGRYQYKFVADGSWMVDPNASELVDDGFGGQNSVLVVGVGPGAAAGAAAGGGATGGGAGAELAAGAAVAGGAALAAGGGSGGTDVTFRYQPMISGVGSVHLVGAFNEWNTTATPMTDADGDGVYETTIPLANGRYAYKFLVDGQNWLEDPNAEESEDDGFGGQNSVIEVGTKTGAAGKPRTVEFAWKPSAPATEIWLAGTFNQWSVGKTALADPDGDGTWTGTLLLPEGEYQYKFVVDGNWTTDPKGDFFVDDGFGGKNSGLVVDERFPAILLELGDGEIFTTGITHEQSIRDVNRISDDEVEFTTRAYNGDVETVSLVLDRGAGEVERIALSPVASDTSFEWLRTVVALPAGTTASYWFEYEDGGTALALAPGGFVAAGERAAAFELSDDTVVRFTTPDWVRDGVFYQIFPERFANGDPSNDPDFSESYYDGATSLPANGKTNGEYYHLVEDWYDVAGLSRSPYRTDGKPDYFSFYGGDIAGLSDKLDYLDDLGVSVIYFNPLFQARSNHKYEAYGYDVVDPHFGTPEEFRAFVDDAHSRGMRVVVDWVCNHIGNHSPQFRDTVKKGKDSEYWEWFEWKKWPLPAIEPEDWREYYECWWGFHHMPDLNYDLSLPASTEHQVKDIADADPNWPVVNYVLDTAEWWLKDMDADGFRLDVANEVPFWFWELFRERCRGVKADSYLVGELWGDAGDYVGPTCFDATMNYKYFKDPVTSFLGAGRGNAARFDRELAAGRMAYPAQATRVMMNLIDSHDTPRALTALGGDPRRLRLIALFQMTYVGAPHIYYGDEILMKGAADPDCRRPFHWKWEDDGERTAMHDWYRNLIHLRRENSALVTGEFRTLAADGGTHAFLRRDDDAAFVVVMNASEREVTVLVPVADVGPEFEDVTGSRGRLEAVDGSLEVPLGPVSGTVLRLAPSS